MFQRNPFIEDLQGVRGGKSGGKSGGLAPAGFVGTVCSAE